MKYSIKLKNSFKSTFIQLTLTFSLFFICVIFDKLVFVNKELFNNEEISYKIFLIIEKIIKAVQYNIFLFLILLMISIFLYFSLHFMLQIKGKLKITKFYELFIFVIILIILLFILLTQTFFFIALNKS